MHHECDQPDDVLFVDAAEHFAKGKRRSRMTDEHVARIVRT